MKRWKILARHKWVSGAVITESIDTQNDDLRRYTATIRGWNNWRIWIGKIAYEPMEPRVKEIISRVITIRNRIDSGDEKVFSEKGAW